MVWFLGMSQENLKPRCAINFIARKASPNLNSSTEREAFRCTVTLRLGVLYS